MGDSGSMLIGPDAGRGVDDGRRDRISQNAYGARDVFASGCRHSSWLWRSCSCRCSTCYWRSCGRTRAGPKARSVPDKMHLHHRLPADRSIRTGAVVLIIYLWVGIVAFGAASTIFFNPRR